MTARDLRFLWTFTLAIAASAAGAAPEPPPAELTLAAALARTEAASPELRAAAAAVEEARGRLVAAGTYPYNPLLSVEGADRDGVEGGTTDRGIALSQEIELAGQQEKRTAAARAELSAAELFYARRRREVLATVERAFAASVEAGELLAIARADRELTGRLVSLEERRLAGGAGTQIAVNLARAAAGRAIRRLQEATAAWVEARARLAEAVGLDPATLPRPVGGLATTPEPVPPVEVLTRQAAVRRSDLAALRREVELAERRIVLERSLAVPNLEVEAFGAREEGDDVLGLRAGIALPVFDRNRGGIAEAEAAVERVSAELVAAELAAGREVVAAYGHYQAAAEAVAALDELVVESLDESLTLLERAVEAGELATTDVLLLRRELVEGQRERIEAAGELWLARIDLELAAGGHLAAADEEGDDP